MSWRAKRQLEARLLYEIVEAQHAMMEADGVDAALQIAVSSACALTRATGAVIELVEDADMVYHAVAGTLAGYTGLRLRRTRSLSGMCVEAQTPLRSDDTSNDPRVDRAACKRLDVASILCLPLRGSVEGVLKVVSDRPCAFGEAEMECVAIFAAAVATRLDQARRASVAPMRALSIESRTTLETVLASMQDAVFVVDLQGEIVLANEVARTVVPTGKPTETQPVDAQQRPIETNQRPVMRALRGETIRQQEVAIRQPDGSLRWYSVNCAPLRDVAGAITGAVSVARDITELRHARDALEAAAINDELTGLLNRRGFMERASSALRLAQRSQRPVALLSIDLNGMKAINDKQGHAMGDRALIEFAELLRRELRDTDLVARLGGDEYVALMLDCPTEADANCGKARLEAALARIGDDPTRAYPLAASIGLIHHDPATQMRSISDLLAAGDAEMYTVKRRNRRLLSQRIARL